MPKKVPASTPRNATAAGTPVLKRTVPEGSSRRIPNIIAARPTIAANRLARRLVLAQIRDSGDPDRGQDGVQDAAWIGQSCVRGVRAQLAQRWDQHQAAECDERGQTAEHPPPGQLLGDPAGDDGPDQAGHNPGAGQRREDPGPDDVRIRLPHDDVHGGDQQSDGQPLQVRAATKTHIWVGDTADHKTRDEQGQADQ